MGQKFPASIWREGNRSFRASVLVAPDVVVQSRGRTRSEAVREARSSTRLYLKVATENSLPAPNEQGFAIQTIRV